MELGCRPTLTRRKSFSLLPCLITFLGFGKELTSRYRHGVRGQHMIGARGLMHLSPMCRLTIGSPSLIATGEGVT